MRKSSRGNPWHDARGRFCHGPSAKTDTWGNPISKEQRGESVLSSEKSEMEYRARTIARIEAVSREERESAFASIINGNPSKADIAVLEREGEYQEELLNSHCESKTKMSDSEIERRDEYRRAAVAYMLAKGEETCVKYADKNGNYSAARKHDQAKIMAEYLNKAESVPHNGECIVSGGLGGAGKTTVLESHLGVDTENYVTINADDIKEIMAEKGMVPYIRGLTQMECSELVHEEASKLSKDILNECSRQKANVILDITMSSVRSVQKRCSLLKERNYSSIQAVFVDISPETSRARAAKRYSRSMEKYTVSGEGNGGRPLPAHVIDSNLSTGRHKSKNAETVISLFDADAFTSTPIVFDNDVDGRSPMLREWNDFRERG